MLGAPLDDSHPPLTGGPLRRRARAITDAGGARRSGGRRRCHATRARAEARELVVDVRQVAVRRVEQPPQLAVRGLSVLMSVHELMQISKYPCNTS